MEENKTVTVKELRDTKRYFQVGGIAGTHGLHGDVRVFPMTDDPTRFKKGLTLFMDNQKGKVTTLTVESSRQNGRFVIVKFQGLNTIEEATPLRGNQLYIDRKDALPLAEGEYYIADVIGLTVQDENGKVLGKVIDVLTTAANDVYVMKQEGTGRELLFPSIPQCVLKRDLEAGIITIHVMDGLFEKD